MHNSYPHFKFQPTIISSGRIFWVYWLDKGTSFINGHIAFYILLFLHFPFTIIQLLMHLLNVSTFIQMSLSLRGDAMFILFIFVFIALIKVLEYFRILTTVCWMNCDGNKYFFSIGFISELDWEIMGKEKESKTWGNMGRNTEKMEFVEVEKKMFLSLNK